MSALQARLFVDEPAPIQREHGAEGGPNARLDPASTAPKLAHYQRRAVTHRPVGLSSSFASAIRSVKALANTFADESLDFVVAAGVEERLGW